MASAKTRKAYFKVGMSFASQAQQAYPECGPLEALCRHAEARGDILKGSTVRVYWQQYCRTAIKIGREVGVPDREINVVVERIRISLFRLKGTPKEPRTSSKKVKDPHDWMVKQVFGHLKLMAAKYGRIRSAACALYCLLVPKLGTRPVELAGAWVNGNVLHVPNAKQGADDEPVRQLDISGFHPTHRAALIALIDIVAKDVGASGYDAWISALAETLARACQAAGKTSDHTIPRLSPSAFRHTAISTWHAAGFTAEEIAELAGHRHIRSQSHYKRNSSAWKVTADLVKPVVNELLPSTRSAADMSLAPHPSNGPTLTGREDVFYAEETGQEGTLADEEDGQAFAPSGPGR